jgi:hypothetical protein
MDQAEVFTLAGQTAAVEAAFDEAVRFYTLKGNLLAVSRARSTLASPAP